MAKRGPKIPDPPSFFQDPTVRPSLDQLLQTGLGLTRGGFMDASNEDVGFLNPLVSLNPEITQQAIGVATRPLVRQQELARKNLINQLSANNQLESSVTANRLGELEEQFSRDISDVSTRFGIADVERSLENVSRLFETGIGTLGTVNQLGQSNQQQRNQFNLANFENQVAKSLSGGSGLGRSLGALGGGALGFAFGGPIGAGIGSSIGGSLFGGGSGSEIQNAITQASLLSTLSPRTPISTPPFNPSSRDVFSPEEFGLLGRGSARRLLPGG